MDYGKIILAMAALSIIVNVAIVKGFVPPEATQLEVTRLFRFWIYSILCTAVIVNFAPPPQVFNSDEMFIKIYNGIRLILSIGVPVVTIIKMEIDCNKLAGKCQQRREKAAAEAAQREAQLVLERTKASEILVKDTHEYIRVKLVWQKILSDLEQEVLARLHHHRVRNSFSGKIAMPSDLTAFRQNLLADPPLNLGVLKHTAHPRLKEVYGDGTGFPPSPVSVL